MSWLKRWLPTNWPLVRRLRRPAGRNGAWVRGHLLIGPEVSSFQPEGSTERWWTSFSDALGDESGALVDSARGAGIEVELSGDVSEPGEFGHMGRYSRTFLVRSIRR